LAQSSLLLQEAFQGNYYRPLDKLQGQTADSRPAERSPAFYAVFQRRKPPQTKLDRDFENGMGVTMGRLREDSVYDYKFVCLSTMS
jgi:aspartate-semialdehyde dehydrogenase